MKTLSPTFIASLRARFSLDWKGCMHGVSHWARVRTNGLILAERMHANAKVVEVFAFVHDSCRHNDGVDREHGLRGAAFVEELRASVLDITDEEAAMLKVACQYHSDGLVDADVTVQCCWEVAATFCRVM